MLIRVRWQSKALEPELEMFRTGLTESRTAWLPWLGSLGAHALVFVLLPVVANLVSWVFYDTVDLTTYTPEALMLRVPIYFTPERAPDPPAPAARRKKPAGPTTAALHDPVPSPAPAPESPRTPLRRFELPPVPLPPRPAPAIIQPEVRIKVENRELPPLAFWARQASAVPKPPRNQFVMPGRVEAPSPAPNLSAPPVLAVPNRELRVADLNVALPNAPEAPRALPLANSTTSPVRLQGGSGEPHAASVDPLQGEAANVISLSTPRLSAQELVTLPKAMGNFPLVNDSAAGATAGAPAGGRGVSDRNAGGRGAGSVNAAGGAASGVSVAAVPPPIRIEHPATGKFDVVLMQSSARDDLPEIGGILTGNPVYSVYLPVGDQKEWLLEYCIPAVARKAANPYEVFVDAPAEISPPYPLLTVVPGNVMSLDHPKYTVVHAFLTVAGQFRAIQAPDIESPLIRALLPVLSMWRFRPATKDRQPVEVEILLVAPPRV